MILFSKRWIAFFLLTFTLLSCGGGGGGDDDNRDTNNDGDDSTNNSLDYSGETKQATLTTENVDDLSTAAASGSKQAISSGDVPMVGLRPDAPVTQEQINEGLARLIKDTLSQAPQLAGRGATAARTQDLSDGICTTGSVTFTSPDDGLAGEWRIVYSNCNISTQFGDSNYSTEVNGTVEGTYVRIGNGFQLTLSYTNFTVTISHPGGSYSDTFNMQMTCSSSSEDGTDISCDYYADYQGYDNRTYRVSEVSVTGSETSGYQVSVRVYDPDHGYVTVTTEVPVTFNCSQGHPSAGRIRIEGANGEVALIEFTSCSQYVVTFEGVAESYTWP
ncbi:MAG: hypothetical protein P8163_16395 [Candidatus Thiodiazotropha sp.]